MLDIKGDYNTTSGRADGSCKSVAYYLRYRFAYGRYIIAHRPSGDLVVSEVNVLSSGSGAYVFLKASLFARNCAIIVIIVA